jgi:hypothetical protein
VGAPPDGHALASIVGYGEEIPMSRTPPERTPAQQREADRIQALRLGTPDAMRVWAERYRVPLFHLDDDELLLVSIHGARVVAFGGNLRSDSQAWLAANEARIRAEREMTR